uniref:Olfactory receptor n=1 Tax=Cynoglossus semilaevis TaxID=244447 RepID=A0A3P8WTX0_CYNSE
MRTSSTLTFIMTAYTAMENYKHWMFCVFLLLYVITVFLNVLLITVIHQNKKLHQPMNVFSCALSLNELYGSTALLPTIMALLLSQTYEMTVRWCMMQVFFLHTYAAAELCILAVMGYDRYIAICKPLHYHGLMSNSRAAMISALAAVYPMLVFGSFFSLTVQISICGNELHKLYCVNMELVKNSCSSFSYISNVGLLLLLILVVPQPVMIVFSYVRILKVCRKLSRESQRNALKTCLPHLLSLLNYTIGSTFEILQTRFNTTHVPIEARIFLSLYFLVTPPIVNPVLYGLGTKLVRDHILKLFIRYKVLTTLIAKALV